VNEDSNSTHVTSSGDHNDLSNIELNKVGDLSSLKVELDTVVNSDQRIGVSNGSSVMENDEGDVLRSNEELLDLAELVLSLISRDGLKNKSSLSIEEESEVLSGLLDGNDILESSGVCSVGSDLSIDLDKSLLDNLGHFSSVKSVSQSISQQNDERKALSQLVRTSGRSRSKDSRHLVQHPMLGSGKSLQMLLRSSSLIFILDGLHDLIID